MGRATARGPGEGSLDPAQLGIRADPGKNTKGAFINPFKGPRGYRAIEGLY